MRLRSRKSYEQLAYKKMVKITKKKNRSSGQIIFLMPSRCMEGVPNLNDRLFKALGDGYPKGYWGCTVVAREIEQEEWVVRSDAIYEGWAYG